jgi:hypothetical protein
MAIIVIARTLEIRLVARMDILVPMVRIGIVHQLNTATALIFSNLVIGIAGARKELLQLTADVKGLETWTNKTV